MLVEGLVGVVALLAAASLGQVYWDINIDLNTKPEIIREHRMKVNQLFGTRGGLDNLGHQDLNLADIERKIGDEPLRGRTGGAVTLAVGMAQILTKPLSAWGLDDNLWWKYWYHFAIMFEALFILTTIDTGTRIARFLLQEMLGKLHPSFEKTDWLPGAVIATLLVTVGWCSLVATGSISTIWPMFGIANQLLAVIALCLVTTMLVNSGRGRYAPVTLLPMLFVTITTMSAGAIMLTDQFPRRIRGGDVVLGWLNIGLSLFVMTCVGTLLLMAVARWVAVGMGAVKPRTQE
jgi:carbon starvation protein